MFPARFRLFTEDVDQCCPGELFADLKPKKGCVLTSRGSSSPRGSLYSVSRHLLPELEEAELDEAWAPQEPPVLVCLHLLGVSEATSCGSRSRAWLVISCAAGRLFAHPLVLELFGGLEQSNLVHH